MAKRLGWLGPAIVITGVLVAAVGAYAVVTGRPKTGAPIERLVVDEHRELVVRAEDGGDRNFVELVEDGQLVWSALIPPYAGRPGASAIAWGQGAITVRVIRNGRAEIFALAMANASKLGGFKLAPGKGEVIKQDSGPVTLTDHVRSYEFVAGPGWSEVVAIDLASGEGVWRQDLGAAPVEAAGIADGVIWIQQSGVRRRFSAGDGTEPPRSPKSS